MQLANIAQDPSNLELHRKFFSYDGEEFANFFIICNSEFIHYYQNYQKILSVTLIFKSRPGLLCSGVIKYFFCESIFTLR